jgi:hypothetical protein
LIGAAEATEIATAVAAANAIMVVRNMEVSLQIGCHCASGIQVSTPLPMLAPSSLNSI